MEILDKDFRELNENEFKSTFNSLKEKTSNFKEFPPELILENNQYLLIIRICLGLSQRDFSAEMGTTKDWCRHLESKKHKIINLNVAKRYTSKLGRLLSKNKILLESSAEHFKSYSFFHNQEFSDIKKKLKPILELDDNKLKKYYNLVKEKTDNFTDFNSKMILEIPQSLLIYRIIIGINHRKFAQLVGSSQRSIRRYEHAETRLKIETVNRIMKFVEKEFKERNLKDTPFEKVLENYRILTNFFGHRNLDAMTSQGLNIIARLKTNKFEKEISELLDKNKIPFDKFSIIEGVKKKYNVDFAIPDSKNPKFVIEAFMQTVGGKSKNTKSKVCSTDHRFQSIKMKNRGVKTITAIKLVGRPILLSFVKKTLELETMNTDYLLINDEIKRLPEIIKIYDL